MKIKVMMAILAIAVAFTGCQKPEKGEAGTPGKDGNANVKSITLNVTGWSWDATNYWRYSSWTNVSILSQDVIDGGAVMLYQKLSTGEYIALPITANLSSTVQEHDFFFYGTNTLKIIIEKSDLTDLNPPGYTYKLVCIPKAERVINPDVNMLDYREVKQAYSLKD
ncbi:MAG: hypothetical protein K0S53_2985 [Bacteroidetes bacterium]|jgi:hypothetical protein|nr:hypothetical protein [Bacteroidota bacterium]